MSSARPLIVGLVIAGFIGYGAYSSHQTDQVLEYNDLAVELTDDMDEEFISVMDHVAIYAEGEQVDVGQARTRLDAAISSSKATMVQLRQADVPDHSECHDLHEVVLQYAENTVAMLETWDGLLDYIEAHNPGTDADIDHVATAIEPGIQKDERLLQQFIDRQQVMADAHGFELIME